MKGHAFSIEELLLKGANCDAADKQGQSPLHIVAENGHTAAIQTLLLKRARVSSATKMVAHRCITLLQMVATLPLRLSCEMGRVLKLLTSMVSRLCT